MAAENMLELECEVLLYGYFIRQGHETFEYNDPWPSHLVPAEDREIFCLALGLAYGKGYISRIGRQSPDRVMVDAIFALSPKGKDYFENRLRYGRNNGRAGA